MKTDGPFENMSFSEKPFEDFNEKKGKLKASTKPPRATHGP